MPTDEEVKWFEARLKKTEFRWRKVTWIVVAIWTIAAFFVGFYERNQRAEQDALLKTKIEDLQQQNAREQKQLDMLPSVLRLVESEKCESDVSAVVLLREMARFRRASEGIGDYTTRATIELMSRRQAHAQEQRGAYCTCAALQFMKELVQAGTDAETAARAKELLEVASSAGGPCAKNPEAQRALVEASQSFGVGSEYRVVLANDTDCEAARAEYRRAAAALRRALGNDFRPELLQIVDGTHRGVDYRVLTYGDKVPLEAATRLVQRFRSTDGLRSDTYWARGVTYRPSQCTPPVIAGEDTR